MVIHSQTGKNISIETLEGSKLAKDILTLHITKHLFDTFLDDKNYQKKLDELHLDTNQKKRLNHIMVELGQNSINHGIINEEDIKTLDIPEEEKKPSTLDIKQYDDTLYITTQNLVPRDDVKEHELITKFAEINNMSFDDLKGNHNEIITNGKFNLSASSNFTGGFWFFDIAKKIRSAAIKLWKDVKDIFDIIIQPVTDKISKVVITTKFPILKP